MLNVLLYWKTTMNHREINPNPLSDNFVLKVEFRSKEINAKNGSIKKILLIERNLIKSFLKRFF